MTEYNLVPEVGSDLWCDWFMSQSDPISFLMFEKLREKLNATDDE